MKALLRYGFQATCSDILLVVLLNAAALLSAPNAVAQQDLLFACQQRCPLDECQVGDIPTGAPMNQCLKQCRQRCKDSLKTAVILPKYYIVTILYAPPGCSSTAAYHCAAVGSVDYQAGSSAGAKTSTQSSFKSGSDVTADASLSIGGINLFGLNVSSGVSTTVTEGSSQTVSKSQNLGIKVQGNGDGIDHGQDTIVLLINPGVSLAGLNAHVRWNLGFDGPSARLLFVTVAQLKNPGTMPAGLAAALQSRGFTQDDFQTILKQDPFAGGEKVAAPRFVPTTWTLPYEPPSTAADCNSGVCACPAFTATVKNEFQGEASISIQTQYSNSYTVKVGPSFLNLKDTETLTWTNTAARSNISSATNSATAVVTCPSPSYTGPVLMSLYWDTIYGSFAFVPVNADEQVLLQQGHLGSTAKPALAHEPVELVADGVRFHTLTDRDGNFKFVGGAAFVAGPTAAIVSAKGAKRSALLGVTAQTLNMVIP